MTVEKPYRSVPIKECGEPMISIPVNIFSLADPHPYMAVGAPYGSASPWRLRASILASLVKAQERLRKEKPGWRIKLHDAFRPIAVYKFMVDREFNIQAKNAHLDPEKLSPEERDQIEQKVFATWAIPSEDPKTPPPHSTGAAFDCTLQDENGTAIDMGSPIDENSDRSKPDYFANVSDEKERQAHESRLFLRHILEEQGFVQHPNEWWHFSRGDQLAVWAKNPNDPKAFAIYGRIDA